MKKRLTFITFLMLFCLTVFGQQFAAPKGYELNMTVIGTISINGEEQTRDNIEIAAYCGDELRGSTKPFEVNLGNSSIFPFILTIGSNVNAETITFKLTDLESETVYGSEYTVTFKANTTIGSEQEPKNINFIPMYWDENDVANYGNTMTVNAFIAIDGQLYDNRSDFEVAAFCGDELRDIARPIYVPKPDKYITMFVIQGKGDEDIDETISFKLYDHSGDTPIASMPLYSDYTVDFEIGKIIGQNPPITLNFIYQSVAKINDQYFTSLAAAVEAATEDNNVITLLKEVTGDGFVINKDVTIDFAGFAYTLNEGEVISIQEGSVATFVNDANITEGVELFGGQLYTTNNNLTIVAKKHFNPVSGDVGATDGWGTISTPVGKVAIPENDNHDLYMYEEATAMWCFYTGGQDFDYFELGTGYLYANKSDVTIELEGKLNVNPLTRQLGHNSEMGALAGFNFVGNPFAHNINEDNFSTTDGAVLSNGFYVISAEGAIEARPENAVISPMESVMVQTDTETDLTISNVPSSKRNAEDNGRLEISVANANYSDVAYVSFNEGRGLNKIGHRNVEIPMVYIPVDGVNYAIAMMNEDVTEIPVSFQAATMGQYTIGVEAQDCEYAMMTLVDRFTGIETNLLIEDYTFIAKSNDSAERFIIKLAMNNSNSEANENFAFINNGMMYIYNIEGQGVVNVYDVTGRPVAEYNVAESANISTSDFVAGVYIIRMSDENGVKVQKIVVE